LIPVAEPDDKISQLFHFQKFQFVVRWDFD
jgi:hypothetical protein